MAAEVRVAGVGMAAFATPRAGKRYEDMAGEAIRAALSDAGLGVEDVQQAFASYVYGDSTCGQVAMYGVGMTGIPLVNVNNNCSSGSSALYLARQAVAGGEVDVALAFGFEQMQAGALVEHWADRTSPLAPNRRVRHLAGDVRPHIGQGESSRGRQPLRRVSRNRSP